MTANGSEPNDSEANDSGVIGSGAIEVEVVSTERISPHLLRVVLAGEHLSTYRPLGVPDEAVALWFPRPGQDRPAPMTLEDGVWGHHDPQTAPPGRNYTVRAFTPGDQARMTVDFVVHPGGVAGEWAMQARPGQQLLITRPRSWFSPPPEAAWVLAAADLTGLPALARIIEQSRADGPPVHALVEIADHEDLRALPSGGGHTRTVEVSVGTGNGIAPGALTDLIARKLPALLELGPGYVWYSGEAGQSRSIRKLLRREHGLPLEQVTSVGYWRQDSERWSATFERVGGDRLIQVYLDAIDQGLSTSAAAEILDEEYEKAGL